MPPSTAILAVSCWLALLADTAIAAEPGAAGARPSPTNAESRPASPGIPAESADPAPAAPPAAAEIGPVKEVALDPTVKPPVCRRYFPTGSRIATERCQSAETDSAASSAEREQTRRDINEMRMRQMARDQARAAAQAEALRQRAGF